MWRRWASVALIAVLALGGCAWKTPGDRRPEPEMTDGSGQSEGLEEDFGEEDLLPEADPAFAAHFTDPLYGDPASELAPFGNDEGWDILHEWDERRDELTPETTVADLIVGSGFAELVSSAGVDPGEGVPEPGGLLDAATIVVGAGFTLLRLTGQIDDEGKRETLRALDILIDFYDSPPELLLQRDDLRSWVG